MKIANNIASLVGKTPLIELINYEHEDKIAATILAKLESYNPAGSVKDRVALAMIKDAEARKLLTKNSVIIEPTSGNTGIGLAALGISRGYRVILVMPDSMSSERVALLKAYGAEVVLTDGAIGMRGAIKKAKELVSEIPHSYMPAQFMNEANPRIHYETTGPEIWNDTDGKVDIFVAGIGTGGTISGIGKYLKEKNPDIKIVGVEPYDSPFLSEGRTGSHKLQGIGAGFIPYTLDLSIIDEIITVKTEEAYTAAKTVARVDGVLGGISSGAALHAAKLLSQRLENDGKTIVVLLPDSGGKYLSTPLYKDNGGESYGESSKN